MADRRLLCCALSAAFVCTPGFSQDSAMFRGDAAHSGIYAGNGVPKLSGVKWKFHTDGEGGVVYFGSADGNLYALN
jgi:eukaryotic-like serine/threonine-protein kinase